MDNFREDLFRDKKYYDQAVLFVDLMNLLNSLSYENFEQVLDSLNTSIISTSKEMQKRFVRIIFNLMRFRSDLTVLFVSLCSQVAFSENLRILIQKQILLSGKLSYCHFYFFRNCINSDYIKGKSIVHKISKYYSKRIESSSNFIKFMPVFLWFLKEIHQFNSDLYDEYLEKINQFDNKEFFLFHVKELQKNDYKLFDQLTNNQFEIGTAEFAIKNDNLSQFEQFALHDPNEVCNLSLFDLFLKPSQHPTYFQLSCLHDSIKCAKYLILNHAKLDKINFKLYIDHLKPKITQESESDDQIENSSDDDVEEIIVDSQKQLKSSESSDDHNSQQSPKSSDSSDNQNDKSSSETNNSDVQIDDTKRNLSSASEDQIEQLKSIKIENDNNSDDKLLNTSDGIFKYTGSKRFLDKLGINYKRYMNASENETSSSDSDQNKFISDNENDDVCLIGSRMRKSSTTDDEPIQVKSQSTTEDDENKSVADEDESNHIQQRLPNNIQKVRPIYQNEAKESEDKIDIDKYAVEFECQNSFLNPHNHLMVRERCNSDENDYDYDNEDQFDFLDELTKEEEDNGHYLNSKMKKKHDTMVIKKEYVTNISRLTTTPQYAVAGGNLEIVRYLINHEFKFENTAQIAIAYFRNDIFYWLIENCKIYALFSQTSIFHNIGDHLFAAIISGNIDIVKYILFNYDIDINSNSCCEHIPLHLAIEYHQYDIVKLLLGLRNINVNVEDVHRKTPYLKAIEEKSIMIMNDIEMHPDFEPNLITYNLYRPVHYAAFYGNADVMQRVLDIPCVDVNDNLSETPIVYAIKANNVSTYSVLKNNPFVDFNCSCNTMFLFAMIEKDWSTQFRSAISNKAVDVNIYNKEGLTPLLFAVDKNKQIFVDLLIDSPRVDVNKTSALDGNSCLHIAAIHNNIAIFQKLKHYISANSINSLLRTPLHVAVINNSINIVNYLLNKTSSPKRFNSDIQLINTSSPKCFNRVLVSDELDVNARDELGKTALHYAAQSKSTELIDHLLEHPDINVNIKDERGNTPFHSSLESYGYGLNLLLRHPTARISEPNYQGQTILHFCVLNNNSQFFSELIRINTKRIKKLFKKEQQIDDYTDLFKSYDIIDINAADENGLTVLHYCCCSKNIEILNTILEYGQFLLEMSFTYGISDIELNFNMLDGNDQSPFQYAAKGKKSRLGLYGKNELELSRQYFQIYKNRVENAAQFQSHHNIIVKDYSANFISSLMEYFSKYMDYSSILDNQDMDGNTFFHLALLETNFNEQLFIDRCHQLDCVNRIGETYLHMAVLGNKVDVVKFLCKKCKSLLNHKTQDGNTPVHYAAKTKNKEILDIFSRMKSVDYSIENNESQKPFDLIEPENQKDFLLYFVRLD